MNDELKKVGRKIDRILILVLVLIGMGIVVMCGLALLIVECGY